MPEATARRRRAIALLIAVPVVLAAAFWATTYTSLFSARHIRVEGNRLLSDRDVREIAGVSTSTNVAHLDEAAAVARLEADPWIADANVRGDLPNTVVVTVTERRPVGVISAMGDTSILADDGTALPVGGVRTEGLPVVRAALGEPTADQRVAAAALLTALDPVVANRVGSVLVGEDGVVSLALSPGITVDAGVQGQEQAKATTLRAILRWATSNNVDVTSIDISSPDAPSIKLSDGSMANF